MNRPNLSEVPLLSARRPPTSNTILRVYTREFARNLQRKIFFAPFKAYFQQRFTISNRVCLLPG